MREPAWFLLLWAALVASIITAWLGFAARTQLGDRHPGRSALTTLLLGMIVYAPIYGVLFETIGTSTLAIGALLGLGHGALATVVKTVRSRRAPERVVPSSVHARRVVARLVYGAVIGLLYVVPPA